MDEHSDIDYESLYKRSMVAMADVCVKREMCRREIMEKLARREVPPGMARRIVDELVERRFIDERRYARAFVRDKMRFNGWGLLKIKMALRMKSIPDDIWNAAIADLDASDWEEYNEKILEVARAKSRRLDLTVMNDRGKLYRFLASRGYSGEEISTVLRQLREEG